MHRQYFKTLAYIACILLLIASLAMGGCKSKDASQAGGDGSSNPPSSSQPGR